MGFIKKIFTPDIPQVQNTELTGRDLVSSTSSEDPNSPELGGSSSKKNSGIKSLLVQSEDIYKGGV